MIPDERDLRRALDARSAQPPAGLASRIRAAIANDAPRINWLPLVAAIAVVALSAVSVGALLAARNLQRTTHGGPASAARVTPSPTETPIPVPTSASVDAATHDVVWVLVAGDHLYRSVDQGNTWERRPMPALPGISFSFVDAREGWFLERGSPATQCQAESVEILHTTDGGATWQVLETSGIADAQCKEYISFTDSRHGFLTTWDDNHRPTIYRTLDGGLTWKPSTLPDPNGFVTEGGGFTLRAGPVRGFGNTLLLEAFGTQDNATHYYQYAFSSTNGGATWSATRLSWLYVYFAGATRWLRFDGQMHETVDAGRTWHPYASDYSQAAGIGPGMVFADASVGYAEVRGQIKRTVDGGAHWTLLHTPGTQQAG